MQQRRSLAVAASAVGLLTGLGAGLALAEGDDGTAVAAAAPAASPATEPHVHDETHVHEPSPDETFVVPAASEGAAILAETHRHGTPQPEVPVDAATRAALAQQLVVARATALAHPTVADAEAAGFRMVTTYMPAIGAHYIRFDRLDGRFDPAEPEMLLYDGTDPGSAIVGLSYYGVGATAPEGFAGPNDHWHQHDGLCFNRDAIVIGGESISDEECARRGGFKVDGSEGWMVHAWVVPGWDSPQGVFSPEHLGLT